MKILIAILVFPMACLAQSQPKPHEKLVHKARVISDSGVVRGYFVADTDSTVILSAGKRYRGSNTMTIPVNSIREMRLRTKTGNNILFVTAGGILGFTLAAGLIQNNTDQNYDGKTSFWELVFAAIEGTTSANRRRRNAALIAGAVGGTGMMVAMIFTNENLKLVFPLNNRKAFYAEKKYKITKYAKF